MIIYQSTKDGFLEDIFNQSLVDKLYEGVMTVGGRVSESEKRSWNNSLRFMESILNDNGQIPFNSGVAIEYKIPYTSKRIDFIITGKNDTMGHVALIIELKQWEYVERAGDKQDMVTTVLGGALVETPHPSYQAWSYVQFIKDYNVNVQDKNIHLQPCAYLHNYTPKLNDFLFDTKMNNYLEESPVFVKKEAQKLRDFINSFIKYGDDKETLYYIERGKIRPSKSLQESLKSMLNGNREFVMIDDQKAVFETAMEMSKSSFKDKRKRVLIVEGGPGTGKSVVAINLLVGITNNEMNCQYVSKNSAPRNVYAAKLKGTMKKTNIDNLFHGSGAYYDTENNYFNALIVDEAHRLNEKSGLFKNRGDNQIKEIINAANFSIFFIDEDQRISVQDIGEIAEIKRFATKARAEVKVMCLESQFRCDGSDGYIAWLDHVLQIRDTANFDCFPNDYDFRVFDDPNELRRAIEEKNQENNRSRLVAGYCWDWVTDGKNKTDVHDINIEEHGFSMSWNLGNSSTWAIDEDSIKEAGCIHTCQGLEFEYVGVIIGKDITYRDGRIITDFKERAKTDQSIKGLKKMMKEDPEKASALADMIIKNTYRTLMTRGQKGCYVYCVDEELANHLVRKIR